MLLLKANTNEAEFCYIFQQKLDEKMTTLDYDIFSSPDFLFLDPCADCNAMSFALFDSFLF